MSVPLGVDVPEGWQAVDPADTGAVLIVVLPVPEGEFRPNITVGVSDPAEHVDLDAAADAARTRLTELATELELRSRKHIESALTPGLTQVFDLLLGPLRLVQSQVHLAVPLPDTAHHVAVELACTCTPSQAERVVPDFQRFVSSFHLRS